MKINGKSVMEVFSALAEPKKCEKYLEEKYPYHAISEYFERMDSVIGKDHYSMHYEVCRMIELPTGQCAYVMKCVITVYDDEENAVPILAAEGYGSSEIKIAKTTGRYLLLNNIPTYARQAAFKDACRRYGIFGEKDALESTDGVRKTTNDKSAFSSNKPKEAILETFLTKGRMKIVRDDAQSGKPVYELSCYKKSGSRILETEYSVVFYPNQYKKEEKKINDFIILLQDGKEHLAMFKTSPASKENVLVFKGFKHNDR